ncbi:MAG: hypothetical protein DRO12_01675 [Thermoprotei archaeon]|nr:MAG: hypothetical protein DRO12_01675 [Thermoprotei archaeon]
MFKNVSVDVCGEPSTVEMPPPPLSADQVLVKPLWVLKDGADSYIATCRVVTDELRSLGTTAIVKVIDVGVKVDRGVIGRYFIALPTCTLHTPVDRNGFLAEYTVYPFKCLYPLPRGLEEQPLTLLLSSLVAILSIEEQLRLRSVLIAGCDSYALAAAIVGRRVASEVAGFSKTFCFSRELGIPKVSLKLGRLYDVAVLSCADPLYLNLALKLLRKRCVVAAPSYVLTVVKNLGFLAIESMEIRRLHVTPELMTIYASKALSIIKEEEHTLERIIPMRWRLEDVNFRSCLPEIVDVRAILGNS